MKRFISITSVLLALGTPFVIFAIGLSATPATLSIRATVGNEAVARFTISNPSKEVGLFEAYTEEFEEFISLTPSRFVLEAGEKREVLVRAHRSEEGIIRTVIAVEAKPLGEPAQGIGGGVRIPFSLEVSPANRNLLASLFASGSAFLPTLGGTLLLLLLFYLWRHEILSLVNKRSKLQ